MTQILASTTQILVFNIQILASEIYIPAYQSVISALDTQIMDWSLILASITKIHIYGANMANIREEQMDNITNNPYMQCLDTADYMLWTAVPC